MALQYGVWAVAAALFGYEAPLWLRYSHHNSHHRSLAWIGLVSILSVIWAVLHINYEFLLIVLYTERVLHKPIADSVGTKRNAVLGFESFIRKRDGLEASLRNTAPSIVFGWGFLVLSAILFIDIRHAHWSHLDWWWVAISGPLFVIVCFKFGRLCFLNRELKRVVSEEDDAGEYIYFDDALQGELERVVSEELKN